MTSVPIGYLISQYPAPSHTFIRREVAALRALGCNITTYSVQKSSPELLSELDRAAAKSTFEVLAVSPRNIVWIHLRAIATKPVRYFQTLRLALRHRVPGLKAVVWSVFHFAEAILLAHQLERDEIKHLHNHFANSGATVGLLASHFLEITWSLTLHGISEYDYPAGLLLADKISAARFVAAVSWFGIAQAMRLTAPQQWEKFVLVRCGVDPDLLPPPVHRPPSAIMHLLSVGRLSPEKGQAGLIDAVAMLHQRNIAFSLTLVGDGPEEAPLRAKVKQLGLSDNVLFVGRLDEIAALRRIAEADVLVLPSFMEGLPVVLMEAMAMGVPVVAARVAGVPELVSDGETGLLFHPADWSGLADALVKLSSGSTLRARLATAGRRRIQEEFMIDEAVRPIEACFADIQSRR